MEHGLSAAISGREGPYAFTEEAFVGRRRNEEHAPMSGPAEAAFGGRPPNPFLLNFAGF
jgi:hypothetical protein